MRRGQLALLPLALVLLGLESVKRPPVPTVGQVDLSRYMGRWYVIANIPTHFEHGAHNSVESYSLNEDGTISTLFTCRKDSFEGEVKTMKPKAFVRDATNAVWGLQFVWPLKVEHLIAYLNPDYSQTIIARTKRDYVWIMARTPTIPDEDYETLAAKVAELGYDRTKLQRVPQRW
jgi:apolipoprotein D and lipocalin family protein